MDTVERADAISNTGSSSPLPNWAFKAVNILEKGGQSLASRRAAYRLRGVP